MSLDVICKAMGVLCVILSREVKWSREKQTNKKQRGNTQIWNWACLCFSSNCVNGRNLASISSYVILTGKLYLGDWCEN